MTPTYLDIQSHYTRVLELLDRLPYEVLCCTYSTGRTIWDREVVSGILRQELNWLGLVLQRMNGYVRDKYIRRAVIVTTEPPQEIEAVQRYNCIEWKQHQANHAKVWYFKFKGESIALVGSRNLTCTLFQEITIEVVGAAARLCGELVDSLWQQSEPLDQQQDWFNQQDDIDL